MKAEGRFLSPGKAQNKSCVGFCKQQLNLSLSILTPISWTSRAQPYVFPFAPREAEMNDSCQMREFMNGRYREREERVEVK